jgi:hypothetical protein
LIAEDQERMAVTMVKTHAIRGDRVTIAGDNDWKDVSQDEHGEEK